MVKLEVNYSPRGAIRLPKNLPKDLDWLCSRRGAARARRRSQRSRKGEAGPLGGAYGIFSRGARSRAAECWLVAARRLRCSRCVLAAQPKRASNHCGNAVPKRTDTQATACPYVVHEPRPQSRHHATGADLALASPLLVSLGR